jgi:hypothetical protein
MAPRADRISPREWRVIVKMMGKLTVDINKYLDVSYHDVMLEIMVVINL